MGAIRKTLSISTLGLVSWKSKKERLREAEEELELTRADLEQATEKHGLIRQRLEKAEHRAQEAELRAIRDAKHARRSGRKETRAKVGRRRVAKATILERVNPLIDSTRESTQRFAAEHEPQLHDAVSEAKRRSREAGAEASKRAKKMRRRAKKTADQAKKTADHAADTVRDRTSHLTSH